MTNDKWLEAKIREELGIPANKEPNYTAAQLLWVCNNRKAYQLQMFAAKFNEIFGTDYKVSRLNSLCKRYGWKTGRTGRFEKGHVNVTPHKRFTTPTSFKKGNIPVSTLPVGSVVVRSDGLQQTKIAEPNVWRLTHILGWEAVNGPLPKGHVLKFKDGNKANIDLNNLELISRAELLRLNHHRYNDMPDELKPSVLSLAKLEVKTFSLQKGSTHE